MRVLRVVRSEGGAAALITVLVTIIMVASLALVVDIGRQYVIKRQLQTSADSAALAAAGVFASIPGSCADIANSTLPEYVAARNAAEAAADAQSESNLTGSSAAQDIAITCPGDGTLVVGYSTELAFQTAFGGALGVVELDAGRQAAAQVFVPTAYTGVRPYAICGADYDLMQAAEGTPVGIRYDNTLTNGCDASPGNWYGTDCSWNEANGQHVNNTVTGCQNPLYVTTLDPPSLACFQTEDVNGTMQDCLSAGPGNINGTGIDNAWRNVLLGGIQQFPVFKPGTVIDAGGNNAQYPIWRVISAKVCGYQWQNPGNQQILDPADPTDPCHGTAAIAATYPPANSSWVVLSYVTSQTSGSVTPSTCSIADCNTRAVRLVE
jgi:hypothetical protein